MASQRKQFGCRPDPETWDRIQQLKERVAKALNMVKVSDTLFLRYASLALEKEYPPEEKGRKK